MIEGDGPLPYHVRNSERVITRLKALGQSARERGDGGTYVEALVELDRLLHLFPQFGEPLVDLVGQSGQIWIGTVAPLSMRYAVLDELRIVMVAIPPVLLPKGK